MKATDRVTCGVVTPYRRTRCHGLATVLAVLVFGAASMGQTTEPRVKVEDVVVYGNRNVPTARIMSYIRTRPGSDYDQNTVEEDVRRLTESRLLQNAAVRKEQLPSGRVIVQFHCYEYPSLIREIVYKNNHHLKPDELDTLTGLRKGAPLNPAQNRQACQAIEMRLREAGRLFASVALEEGGQPGDSRVVFNITEGPIVRVRSIHTTGQTFVGEARLKTQIDTHKAFLNMIGGVYNPNSVEHDAAKLVEYYRSFGYLDVQVTRELKFTEDYSMVDIVFHVAEGRRYQVSRVFVEGVKAQEPAAIGSLTKLKQGEPYNKFTATKDQNAIKDYYGWRGYEALVQERVTVDNEKPGFVQVSYDITERPPAKAGAFIITGNEVTKDRVILHEINIFPGQLLTYPELKIAERNLARRNIFEVNPEQGIRPTVTVIDKDDSDIKDILVQVKETHTGSLMFGIGVNSDAGLVGSVVLNERNFDLFRPPTSWADIWEGRAFRGNGQEMRIEAVPGTQLQRYTISFREPYLFDTKFALGVSGYYYDRIYNEDTERRMGGRFTLDRILNEKWIVSAGLRIEDVRIGNVVFFAPPDYTSVVGDHFLIAPRVGIRRDTRDSYLRPTEGSKVEFSYEQVFGDFAFPIFNLEASKYWTLFQRPDGSGRHVLAAHSQLAWEGSNAPVYERFFAGGFSSMRGFEFRGVGPNINGFMVGGDFMWLNSLEYQLPVRANDQLYFVAFVDSGTVESSFEFKNYRVAAGFGARIIVPLLGPVPIALDFGFPIVKASTDRDQVFSFWIGAFR
jgi:outer membrane protein assembly factor BamA